MPLALTAMTMDALPEFMPCTMTKPRPERALTSSAASTQLHAPLREICSPAKMDGTAAGKETSTISFMRPPPAMRTTSYNSSSMSRMPL